MGGVMHLEKNPKKKQGKKTHIYNSQESEHTYHVNFLLVASKPKY